MVEVIGYSYDAALHCVDCTQEQFAHGGRDLDSNGIPYTARDREGNSVHAIFSTDEVEPDECCDDCGGGIRGA